MDHHTEFMMKYPDHNHEHHLDKVQVIQIITKVFLVQLLFSCKYFNLPAYVKLPGYESTTDPLNELVRDPLNLVHIFKYFGKKHYLACC